MSKDLVTDPEDELFTRMTSLHKEYQALLARARAVARSSVRYFINQCIMNSVKLIIRWLVRCFTSRADRTRKINRGILSSLIRYVLTCGTK